MTVCASAARAAAITVSLVLVMARCAPKDRPPALAQSIFVDPQPTQVIEGSAPDGAPLLGLVSGATRLADGTIVVGDASASSLKFFDGQMRLIRTIGWRGQGPGEFSMLGAVRQCGLDSLFASDVSSRDVLVFSASGTFVRRIRLERFVPLVACSRQGVLVFVKSGEEEQPPEGVKVWRMRAPVFLADALGASIADLGTVPLGEIAQVGNGWLPRLGGPLTTVAVGNERGVVCPADSGGIGTFSLGGKWLRRISLDVPFRAPSRQTLERLADQQVALAPAGPLKDTVRVRLLRAPAPAHLPPCSKVLMDPDDNIWVVLSFPGDSMTGLRIIAPDDAVIGEVTVPAAMDVLEIGSDYLLGSGESGDGEPWVRLYRVRRTARP